MPLIKAHLIGDEHRGHTGKVLSFQETDLPHWVFGVGSSMNSASRNFVVGLKCGGASHEPKNNSATLRDLVTFAQSVRSWRGPLLDA